MKSSNLIYPVVGLFILNILSFQIHSEPPPGTITVASDSVPLSSPDDVFTNLDSDKLAIIKERILEGDIKYKLALNKLLTEANKALKEGPFSVMQKTQEAPSGDKHDYLSLAPYWWPDPSQPDGLPWIRKDGEVNPMTRGKNVDNRPKTRMMKNVELLSLAYFFSGKQNYADKTIELLTVWFIDPATKMNPNLNYAQGVPGTSEGRGYGIIEFVRISRVITAIEILESQNALIVQQSDGMRQWLKEYLEWLQTSELGLFEQSRLNNHGTLYDVQVVGILLFLDRIEEAKMILEEAKIKRIAPQILPDGTQPAELKRTKSLSYSITNLSGLTQLAYFGKRVGVDLWNYEAPDAGSIQKAYEFLYPYAVGEKLWERQQIGNTNVQVIRLQQLFLKTGSMLDIEQYCMMASNGGASQSWEILTHPCF